MMVGGANLDGSLRKKIRFFKYCVELTFTLMFNFLLLVLKGNEGSQICKMFDMNLPWGYGRAAFTFGSRLFP